MIPDKVKQMVRDTVARMDERLPSPSRIPLPRRVLSTIFEEEAAHIRPPHQASDPLENSPLSCLCDDSQKNGSPGRQRVSGDQEDPYTQG